MTQPRPSTPRSSLAIALQYYKGPRPGVALTISAFALIAAVVIGVVHVAMLGQSGLAIAEGQTTMRTLHRYNAALEVWRQMAAMTDRELQFPEQLRLRDSIHSALTGEFTELRAAMTDTTDQRLLGTVLSDLQAARPGVSGRFDLGTAGRSAMIVLAARQDSALFRAAQRYQRSQFFAAVVIGLTVLAAAAMIFPIAWVYVRFKQGIPMGV